MPGPNPKPNPKPKPKPKAKPKAKPEAKPEAKPKAPLLFYIDPPSDLESMYLGVFSDREMNQACSITRGKGKRLNDLQEEAEMVTRAPLPIGTMGAWDPSMARSQASTWQPRPRVIPAPTAAAAGSRVPNSQPWAPPSAASAAAAAAAASASAAPAWTPPTTAFSGYQL